MLNEPLAYKDQYKTLTIIIPADVFEALEARIERCHKGLCRPSTLAALALADQVYSWTDWQQRNKK